MLLAVTLFPFGATAQKGDIGLLKQAHSAYEIGKFDQVIELLPPTKINNFASSDKLQAYRLISLSQLAMDNRTDAEMGITEMLKIEPYYTPSLQDPLPFVKLVKERQSGKATLTTASQLAETLEEAPVPVTLITEEMIKAIGAKTLKEVLTVYVPGMNDVASANEVNVAMRGVYTVGQQKILIMLNGHRLNSRTYNGANPDFSISLEKVKQIEVLRGPASSLYGNVALTAVVNIISKEGYEVDGLKIKAGGGSFGEVKADLLFGKRFLYMDFMAWASVYRANGEKYFVSRDQDLGNHPRDGYTILGGYKDKPSYDYGFTFKWKNLSMLFNQRYSKMVEPFNSLDNMVVNPGSVHDYDRYRLWDGKEGPGAGFGFTHAELKYENTFGNKFAFDATVYYDNNRNNLYTALGDTADIPPTSPQRIGPWQLLIWNEYAAGLTSKGSFKYGSGSRHTGNLIFGVQVDYMNMYNQLMCNGGQYTQIASVADFLPTGGETSYSVFAQNKHNFTKSWVLNAGVRFDYKVRKDNRHVQAVSPRVSLIYIHPANRFNAKISYARSFVDAPYFYRYNFGIESFTGNANLDPENLDSWQFTVGYKPIAPLHLEANMFLNYLTHFIYNDKKADIEHKESPFKNAGELQSMGIEGVASLELPRFMAKFNLTWQNVLTGESYSFRGTRVYNIPPITSNLVLNWVAVKTQKWGTLSLRTNVIATSTQLSPIEGAKDPIKIGGVPVVLPNNEVDARVVWSGGLRYAYRNLEVGGQCYNILNHRYVQGGTTMVPYIQPGRWFSFDVSYKF